MKTALTSWISAARLHTLPLSLAGVMLGSFLAVPSGKFSFGVLGFSLTTAVLLQVLANLANDLGDYQKGTDNPHRTGPKRMLQSGKISPRGMKKAIVAISITAFISGGCLLFFSTRGLPFIVLALFLGLGVLAIIAALTYTLGKRPYGYYGFGDLFVFIFFGLLSVLGVYFLHVHSFSFLLLLPAISVGLLAVAVMNLNNLRDIKNDKISGKKTLAVILGLKGAKAYHTLLIVGAMVSALGFIYLLGSLAWYRFASVLAFPFFVKNLINVYTNASYKMLILELKHLSLATFLFALLLGISLML